MAETGTELCELCGQQIPRARREALRGIRTCVACQRRVERGEFSSERVAARERFGNGEREVVSPMEVEGDLVRLGGWSARMMEVVGKTVEVKGLVERGEVREARALVQALPLEAQAALVVMDENPEGILSLTAMDEKGRPGYSTAVVTRLPSETIADIVSVRPDEKEWNTALLKSLTPATFRRTVEDTLDPIDDQPTRGKVSFEWLQAVGAMGDTSKAAELLQDCSPELIEDALVARLDTSAMNRVAGGIHVFRYFSEESAGAMRPGRFIQGEVGAVLDALYDSAPGLISEVVRRAWERTVAGDEDDITPEESKRKRTAGGKQKTRKAASDHIRDAVAEVLADQVEPESEDDDQDLSVWGRSE